MTIGILIMAAGHSQRFKAISHGQHKLLAEVPCTGKTVLESIYDQVRGCFQADEILIITNDQDHEVNTLANTLNSPVISIETDGLGTSIHKAIQACQSGDFKNLKHCDALFVLPADLPFIQPETLKILKAQLTISTALTIRPSFQGHVGHPVGFRATLFPALMDLSGDDGAKSILKSHKPEIIAVTDSGILWDIDTPKDLLTMPQDNLQSRNN